MSNRSNYHLIQNVNTGEEPINTSPNVLSSNVSSFQKNSINLSKLFFII